MGKHRPFLIAFPFPLHFPVVPAFFFSLLYCILLWSLLPVFAAKFKGKDLDVQTSQSLIFFILLVSSL